jgi:hypothetical protein
MPRDTNPVVVVVNPDSNTGTDVAGNPTTGSGLTGGGRPTQVTSNTPAQETGETNPPPLLITPNVEAPENPPRGSGTSVVVEPELGTPIVRDEPTPITVSGIQPPTLTDNPVKNLINTLPTFLGGGGGGAGAGAGGGGGTEDSIDPNAPKKPNYILYGGILLAVIIAYKVLSKKENNN